MSAALQLGLDLPAPRPKRKVSAAEITCKCGREQADHANRRHTGACAITGCKRFRPRKRPPVEIPAHLGPPNGAIMLERDDTKRAKAMGWALVDADRAKLYLSQLKTQSPNKGFFGKGMSHAMLAKMGAMQTAYRNACRERTISAIAQLGVDVVARGRPSLIVVTRVSSGKLDRHDNLRGALKFIVDGIAEALGFNDAELEDSASRAGSIAIKYSQEKPGAPRVRGVRIELSWGAS